MSDEQNIEKDEKKCSKKCFIILLATSLVLSLLSLGLSIYNTVTLVSGAAQGEAGKVLISKKYDKGQSLQKAYKKQKPVIVFFYADWCGFCQRFAPTFYKITKDKKIKKNFAIAYVNCDKPENREYMEQFNIQGFPTVYVIRNDRSRVHLDNNTFFNEDSVDIVKKDILKAIEEQ